MGWKEVLLGSSGATDTTDGAAQSVSPALSQSMATPAAVASATGPVHKGEGQLSVDVFETADAIVIVAPIAGVRKEDIKVTVTDDVLEIKGFRRFQEAVRKEQFYSQECFWGAFSRAVVLPARGKPDQVRASLKEGVLRVTVPKVHLAKAQEVPIGEDTI